MFLQIVSDLHLEAPAAYDTFKVKSDNAEYLALIGDIGHVQDPGLYEFLSKQLLHFAVVFFVCRNHEPYHSDWPTAINKLNEYCEKTNSERSRDPRIGEFVLSNRSRHDISPSVTILGCTLFSNFLAEQSDHVSFGLNDFYYIKDWTVKQHCESHNRDIAWIDDQVLAIPNAEPSRNIFILTHNSPTIDPRGIDPAHRKGNISSGFSADLTNHKFWHNESIKLWAFGHSHFNCDLDEDGKSLFANQRGYYFTQAAGFVEEKVIELE